MFHELYRASVKTLLMYKFIDHSQSAEDAQEELPHIQGDQTETVSICRICHHVHGLTDFLQVKNISFN